MAVCNQELADKRLGERAIMKNGQQATIIAYRGATDIDIQFDDGTVVERRSYNEFKLGSIRNPQYTPPNPVAAKRIGETRTMSNGQKATIVQYRTSTDIDVVFENGDLRRHVRYPHFCSGKVRPIDNVEIQQSRVGEERLMNCGQVCKIIKYDEAHNITVQFEDGTVLPGKYYTDFLRGAIVHPGVYNTKTIKNKHGTTVASAEQIGMVRQMLNGHTATIIEYRNNDDMDVEFEDGQIRRGVSFFKFTYGKLEHPDELPDPHLHERVGETNKMHHGRIATIIRYRGYRDIDVMFNDGVVVMNQRYEKFLKGEIAHPNIKFKNSISLQEFAIHYYLRHLGFRKVKQGEWADKGFGRLELDFYHERTNIAIEYDGAIHNKHDDNKRELTKNQRCRDIGVKLYRIRDPMCHILEDGLSINYTFSNQNKIFSNLWECKDILNAILEENNIFVAVDFIDINRDRDKILSEFNETYINYYTKTRLGRTVYSPSAKQNMTVTAYRDSCDIDIRFDDGAVRQNVRWSDFIVGSIAHPNDTPCYQQAQRLGQTIMLKNGFSATIIAYRCSTDIDVEFDDGAIRAHVGYDDFKLRQIKHPLGLSRKVYSYKKVINTNTNALYKSIYEASEQSGISVDAIRNCCLKKSKTAGGIHWEYYE